MKTITKEVQAAITPAEALKLLREGNQRFVNNQKASRDLMQQAKETAQGQYPFAVVLSCIDSRTSSELVFDLGMGDIFSIRIAGNVVNDDILGSMEFACKLAGSKLIAVIGHTGCGAVKGACDHAEMGHLTTLLSKITPVVDMEKTTPSDRSSKNATFVYNVTELNVKHTVKSILERSSILKEMYEAGQIGLVGGMHDLASGTVTFYEDAKFIK